MEEEHLSPEFRKFVQGFHRVIKENNKEYIKTFYEGAWHKNTDKFKAAQNDLPTAERISSLVENDVLFLHLYRELYFRHHYSHFGQQMSIEKRFASWENYNGLFDFFLSKPKPVVLDLPLQWIWDIIDEFLYQYQEFCQYRIKGDRSPAEIQKLKESPKVWNTVSVIKVLHRLISLSDIKKTLEREKSGSGADSSNPFATNPTYSNFGLFGIIGLCRLHCILGDYYLALKTVDPIDMSSKKVNYTTKLTAAHISLFYYTGFAYMMTRRYQDAIKTFCSVLLFCSRQHHTRQYDQKKSDQMYSLLAILLHFCPRRIDEHISNNLKQDHADKILSIQSRENEDTRGADNFSYGCPKFVTPSIPNFDDDIPAPNATAVQKKLFMKEINQCAPLPTIGSYLKLYTTISAANLISLLDQKHDKDTLKMFLARYVHKDFQLQCAPGQSPSQGTRTPASDVTFSVEGDVIQVGDNKITRNYAEVFINHCTILEDIRHDLEKQAKK
uniref:Eukaryotic translation initiation factor 3 subunit L n=1 Tax=Arcella intermedia TaxID=1963864 RepID=A0A6B2L2I0_9EUKA